ncbi:GRP2 putative NADPH-dependent methylglyoxal reductase GRP2 [Candida maltosa Xu316]|uniref:NAD-dependent epimerase/dehydratase domain-containing protein n=1 Tax=Candida maltosa (strain Xu316) TaxID=1245528 RepID=M3J206_CANMX|nr:hypothetical protein G210_3885 [Candida maltosa Xu316]
MDYQHKTTVFVTGATGYIAQHIVSQLIEKGYKVVGSVTTKAKGEAMAKLVGPVNFKYEIVPDVTKPGAFIEALDKNQSARYFIHTATPYTFNVNEEKNDEMLQKAIDSTKNVFKSIQYHGIQVRKVVLTSSMVAVAGFGPFFDPNKVYTENDWNPISWDESLEPANGYYGSKKFAELAAWEYWNKNKPYFKLTVINPVYVFGPQAFEFTDTSSLATSAEKVSYIANLSSTDKIPEAYGRCIDVRDVARAHVLALENEETSNRRLLLVGGAFSNDKIAHIINQNFPNCNVPDGDLARDEEEMRQVHKIDDSNSKNVLGFEYIPLEKTITDSINQIYAGI